MDNENGTKIGENDKITTLSTNRISVLGNENFLCTKYLFYGYVHYSKREESYLLYYL